MNNTSAIFGKFAQFIRAPLPNALHTLSNLAYRTKGILFYRLIFKQFGRGSCIRKPLLILNPRFISIGERVFIRDGVRLEVVISSDARTPELVIGNATNIEQNVHIVCHSRVRIGANVSITANCAIVDVTHPFSDVRDPQKIGSRIKDENSFVEIGDGSFVGFGAVILPNVRIGVHSVIGANSVVTKDIPDYAVAGGIPAVVLKRFDFSKGLWIRPSSTPVSQVQE